MYRPLLTAYLFFAISVLLSASPIPLPEAVKKGLISVENTGEGGYSGQSVKLTIRSLTNKTIEVAIPAGLIFESQDTLLQDLIVIRSKTVAIEKDKNRIVRLFGMCTQASYGSPDIGSLFLLGALASGNLMKIVQYIDEHRLTDESAQHAIWTVTDGHSVTNIAHPGLKKLAAELTGQQPAPYTVRHGRVTEVQPYEPAFRPNPVVIEGVFEYQTSHDINARFGIYNEANELIHPLFENQHQPAGFHKFKFTFEIRNLPKGKYFARMTSGDRILGELEMEW